MKKSSQENVINFIALENIFLWSNLFQVALIFRYTKSYVKSFSLSFFFIFLSSCYTSVGPYMFFDFECFECGSFEGVSLKSHSSLPHPLSPSSSTLPELCEFEFVLEKMPRTDKPQCLINRYLTHQWKFDKCYFFCLNLFLLDKDPIRSIVIIF